MADLNKVEELADRFGQIITRMAIANRHGCHQALALFVLEHFYSEDHVAIMERNFDKLHDDHRRLAAEREKLGEQMQPLITRLNKLYLGFPKSNRVTVAMANELSALVTAFEDLAPAQDLPF